MDDYATFLNAKHQIVQPSGFDVSLSDLNPHHRLFQRDTTRWGLKLGRAALFANVGLGKTLMQLDWARLVSIETHKPVLILSPLAVAPQTVREGEKFGIEVRHIQSPKEMGGAGVYITNYDRVKLFDADRLGGVVLDESSILKHYTKTFFGLTEKFARVPFRLCATATPSPNDFVELGNHSMFLDYMHFKDMLARWFVGEGKIARKARLKQHARADYWRWLTSWAVCISKPSDLGDGYHVDGYDLPAMNIHEHRLSAPQASIDRAWAKGQLLPESAPSATGFMKAKRESLPGRVAESRDILEGIPSNEPVILWCDTDFEADALVDMLTDFNADFVEVRGKYTPKRKEQTLEAFSRGDTRIIVTKPEIAGFGLNWQHCANMIFAGVSFSFERWYQSVGRVYRYGQTRPVDVHMVYAETEGQVMETLRRKQKDFAEMQEEMNAAMREHGLFRAEDNQTVFASAAVSQEAGDNWTYHLGDCIPTMEKMDADSVDLTVTSIPFSNQYIYSDSNADVGNAANKGEFFDHLSFVIRENYRITRPGRCLAVHVKDLPLFKNRDEVMGIDPFSDDVTAAYRKEGWVLLARITVEKDPVIEMRKTNSHGLLFKSWRERAEILRTGLPDYVLVFQKPGDVADKRITHDPSDKTYYGDNPPGLGDWLTLPSRGTGANNLSLPVWQRYANPNWSDVVVPLVWTDIDQTDVLNYLVAKSDKDERHICPLQLDLIGRVIHWKSNPGDVVFDPFGGIASTGYKALEMGRKFVGVELKAEYHALGLKYLKEAEILAKQPDLWSYAESQKPVVEAVGD